MTSGTGKQHRGARRGPRQRTFSRTTLLVLAVGVTLNVVVWGYLVGAAIDFGSAARRGNPGSWGFLALASLGAVCCLFVALMLVARVLREVGLTAPARAPGRRRAAR